MNLKDLHTEQKAVQTNALFEPKEKVISLQIAKDEQLKEHITKVPALLVNNDTKRPRGQFLIRTKAGHLDENFVNQMKNK